MVFFTCGGCGEAVKKAQVEKHRWKCHQSAVVSCIDCSKDFHGNEYQLHNKCVSEDQKYGGQNYVGKANKGEVKQEKWFEQVQRAINSTDVKDRRLRSLLEQLENYPNVPRKQQKFESFLKNSLRIRDSDLVSAAWSAIAACVEKEKIEEAAKVSDDPKKDAAEPRVDDKKRKAESESVQNGAPEKRRRTTSKEDGGDDAQKNGQKKFKWRKAIKANLKATSNGEIKLKKLRQSVFSEYKGSAPEQLPDEELKDAFDQAVDRLTASEFLILDGKIIRLVKSC